MELECATEASSRGGTTVGVQQTANYQLTDGRYETGIMATREVQKRRNRKISYPGNIRHYPEIVKMCMRYFPYAFG